MVPKGAHAHVALVCKDEQAGVVCNQGEFRQDQIDAALPLLKNEDVSQVTARGQEMAANGLFLLICSQGVGAGLNEEVVKGKEAVANLTPKGILVKGQNGCRHPQPRRAVGSGNSNASAEAGHPHGLISRAVWGTGQQVQGVLRKTAGGMECVRAQDSLHISDARAVKEQAVYSKNHVIEGFLQSHPTLV